MMTDQMSGRNISGRKQSTSASAIRLSRNGHHRSFENIRSHSLNNKKKSPKIIHVAVRSQRSIHPADKNFLDHNDQSDSISSIVSARDYQNQSKFSSASVRKTKSLRSVTNSGLISKKINAPMDRIGTINDNHHQNSKNKKKKNYCRWCTIICVVTALLLIITAAVVLPIMLTKTVKTSTSAPVATLRWNTTGTTVAGITSSPGTNASQLSNPYGLAWDSSGALYIADYSNNRVQKWIRGASVGVTVAGQANGVLGNDSQHLFQPVGLLLDPNDNLYVADRSNQRVQSWLHGASSGTVTAGVTGNAGSSNSLFSDPSDIVRDPISNTLYISDTYNHRVMSYLPGALSGNVVAGGNGQGANNTQLNDPIGMQLDSLSNSLFIANYRSHSIVRWVLGSSYCTLIAGSNNNINGATAELLNGPVGIAQDPMGNIYVADSSNHRIQLFLADQSTGTTIAGVSGIPGTNSTLLNLPFWVILDNQLNLYVADFLNNRVQKFTRY